MIYIDDTNELAALLLNKDYNDIIEKDEMTQLDSDLWGKYNIGLSEFHEIIKDLVKFTPSWKSPLTGTLYRGFVKPEGKSLMKAIVKEEIK